MQNSTKLSPVHSLNLLPQCKILLIVELKSINKINGTSRGGRSYNILRVSIGNAIFNDDVTYAHGCANPSGELNHLYLIDIGTELPLELTLLKSIR